MAGNLKLMLVVTLPILVVHCLVVCSKLGSFNEIRCNLMQISFSRLTDYPNGVSAVQQQQQLRPW